MSSSQNTGSRGEELASKFLQKNNYIILEQNYRFKRSEIDIIAKKNEILVFVEVKTRRNAKYGYPEEFVDSRKAEKVHEGAEEYMIGLNWEGPIRFDIISVLMNDSNAEIQHFEDAF